MIALILAMAAAAQGPGYSTTPQGTPYGVTTQGSGVEVGDLPNYNALPHYSQTGIQACKNAYSDLETFEGRFEDVVWNRTLTRGGKLTMPQNIAIRNASNLITQRYEDAIRHIAWQGRADDCRALAQQGKREITERVIRPVFQ